MRFISLAILLLLTVAGCHRGDDLLRLEGETMGTTWSVVFRPPGSLSPQSLRREIQGELDRINSLMSTYEPDSELSRFNDSRTTSWVSVSPDTARVVALALEVSRLTEGAFDVTVGPLVDRWGFGPKPPGTIPTDAEVKEILTRVGYRHLFVRENPPAIRKEIPDLRIDLSAVAKGYGVDRVADILSRNGVDSFLVEVGGEMVARGGRPDNTPWRIAIERPLSGRREAGWLIRLADGAVATSGNYRNVRREGGVRYGHTIDPVVGMPVVNRVGSVTVIDDRCDRADAFATGLLALGEERGLRLAQEKGVAAFFVIHDEEGFREMATDPFRRRVGW
ncbi:MAG: FAD:protein FMN transferase [Desulfuromonadia bacterium]